MKKEFLEVGQIVGVQGIKGEVRVNPLAFCWILTRCIYIMAQKKST